MSFLDDLGSKVSQTWTDVTSTGVPAVIAGAENYAAQQLSQQAQQNQQAANAAAAQVVASSPPSTGIMKSIQDAFASVGASTAVKQYGGLMLAGVAGLLIVGFVLRD